MRNIFEIINEEIDTLNINSQQNNNPEPDYGWAIFRIANGHKYYVIKIDTQSDKIIMYDSGVKYSDRKVLKFSEKRAAQIIKKNMNVDKKYGIVNSRGVQKLYDWSIRYDNGLS